MLVAFSLLCFQVSIFRLTREWELKPSFCVTLFKKINTRKCLHILRYLEGKPFWGQYEGDNNVPDQTLENYAVHTLGIVLELQLKDPNHLSVGNLSSENQIIFRLGTIRNDGE